MDYLSEINKHNHLQRNIKKRHLPELCETNVYAQKASEFRVHLDR